MDNASYHHQLYRVILALPLSYLLMALYVLIYRAVPQKKTSLSVTAVLVGGSTASGTAPTAPTPSSACDMPRNALAERTTF